MNEELMNQLLEETQEGNRLQRRHTMVTTICCVLLVVLICVLGWVGVQLAQTGQGMQQMADVVSQFDTDQLERSLQAVEQQLAKLDVDALNETLKHAGETAAHMEKAAEGFEAFAQGMGGLFGKGK